MSCDANQRIGGNALASVTINTDLQKRKSTPGGAISRRFPLFFPEKRTFFLEGSDIFEFGLGLSRDVRPFFSRRIGLLQGREVPIAVGTKINGRIGATSLGALAVRTGDLDSLPTANTMSVLRLKQNILGESPVGMIATFGDPQGLNHSWLAGVDLTYQTSRFRGDRNFLAGIWGLAMNREGLDSAKSAPPERSDCNAGDRL